MGQVQSSTCTAPPQQSASATDHAVAVQVEFESKKGLKPVFHFIDPRIGTRRFQALWVNCIQLVHSTHHAAAEAASARGLHRVHIWLLDLRGVIVAINSGSKEALNQLRTRGLNKRKIVSK
jgi:hypothetical protein